jgi:cell pole-organizing protein PopZ
MQSPGREPSMEDILASIKKVIAEEKDMRAPPLHPPEPAAGPPDEDAAADPAEEDVLELGEPLAPPADPPVDLGPPLIDQDVAETSRHSLDVLSSVAATAPPPPQVNPLEELVREMLRPILKQWLDDHLPGIVDEHVKREITRITGRRI